MYDLPPIWTEIFDELIVLKFSIHEQSLHYEDNDPHEENAGKVNLHTILYPKG